MTHIPYRSVPQAQQGGDDGRSGGILDTADYSTSADPRRHREGTWRQYQQTGLAVAAGATNDREASRWL